MVQKLSIDFVSDVSCPWCAVGLGALESALQRLGGAVDAELHFQPFELNPRMGPQGQDIVEHLQEKYGSTAEQQAANWEALRQRAATVGVDFREGGRGRIWNTFDAHRLLHWAGLQGPKPQHALKKALLEAYFSRGESPADETVLLAAAERVGLDREQAREVLSGGQYAQEVREREAFYTGNGIQAVPSVIVNNRHLIQGGQPPEVFEQALRQIASGQA